MKQSIFNKQHTRRKSFKEIKKDHRREKKKAFVRKLTKKYKTATYTQDYKLLKSYLKKRGYKNYRQFLKSKAWKSFKKCYYEKHSKCCDICNSRDNVQLHHIHYGNPLNEKAVKPLCKNCHKQAHNFALEEGKSLKNTYESFKQYKKRNKVLVVDSVWATKYFNTL